MSDRHIEQGGLPMRQLYEFAHNSMGEILKKRGDKVPTADLKKAVQEALQNVIGDQATEDMVDAAMAELVAQGNIKETNSGNYKLLKKKLVEDTTPAAPATVEAVSAPEEDVDEDDDDVDEEDDPALAALMAEYGDDDDEADAAAAAVTAAAHETMNNLDPADAADDFDDDPAASSEGEGNPATSTEDEGASAETGPTIETPPVPPTPPVEAATPPPIPLQKHHTAHYNDRKFDRWASNVEDIHSRLLRLLTNVDTGELKSLKQDFKQLTGEEWDEEFEMKSFIADKKTGQIDNRESDAEAKRDKLSGEVAAYLESIDALFERHGIPNTRTGDRDIDDMVLHINREGIQADVALLDFVVDLRDEQLQIHEGDVVKAERAVFLILARIEDKLIAYQKERDFDEIPEETPELIAARTAFLEAQENYNEFQKRLNPFKRGKKELIATLEAARTAYEVETAKAIAGRSHRFLNEFNRQIDAEIAVRQERIDARPKGFIEGIKNGKFKDAFYGAYKTLGDMSLDRAYQKSAGEEPTKGRFLRKALNVRTAIGVTLGVAGLMTGPLKAVWRGAIGTGAAIGVYEGLKAKESKSIQVDAQNILATLEANADGVRASQIIEVMQQIRMRAALDGKTVTDEKFILHKSFASLLEALNTKVEAVPKEKRIAARENADKLNAVMKRVNGRMEEEITRQGNQRRKQAAVAVGAGVGTAVFMPQIMKRLGWSAEQLADLWVGDPAVSGEVFAQAAAEQGTSTAEHVAAQAASVAEGGNSDLPGTAARVSIDSGEGAYHAVYKLLDTMTDADQQALGEAIATEHPEWVQTDANGDITNLDRVLRHWRHDIVRHAVTDSGQEIMLYDASSGEYHTMLHTDAEFGIVYDNGYPELRIYGADGGGTFNSLDEPLTRVVHADGSTEFVHPGEEAAAIEAHEPTFDTDTLADTIADNTERIEALGDTLADAASDSPYEMLPDTPPSVYDTLGDATAPETADGLLADGVNTPDATGDGTTGVDTVAPESEIPVVADEVPPVEVATADTTPTVDGEEPLPAVEEVTTPVAPEVPTEQVFAGNNGRDVSLSYDSEGNITGLSSHMQFLRNGDVQSELLASTDSLRDVSYMDRDSITNRLKGIYVMDEVIDNMIENGLEGTPEYEYLVDAVEQDMEIVADSVGTPVETLFDADIVEAYDFDSAVPTVDTTVDAVTPEVSAPTEELITQDLYDRVIENRGNLTPVERDNIGLYLGQLSELGLQLDAATSESAQASIYAEMVPLRDNIVALLDTVESR